MVCEQPLETHFPQLTSDMSKRSAEEEIGTAEKKVCTEELNGNGAEHKEESIAELKAKVAANDSDKPTLYHMQHCSSCRPLVVIEELGIGDKVNVVTIASKEGEVSEHKKSEYLALNAHGTVRIPHKFTFPSHPIFFTP